MSAMEYILAETGVLTDTPRQMENIFRAKLLFEGVDPDTDPLLIREAVEAGIALAAQLSHVY